jgi:hypothetical protein
MTKSHVLLSDSDHLYLTELVGTGTLSVKPKRRVQALLWLHQGQGYQEVAALLTLRYTTVSKWAATFRLQHSAALPVRWQAHQMPATAAQPDTTVGALVEHRWMLTNYPALVPEPLAPAFEEQVPVVCRHRV